MQNFPEADIGAASFGEALTMHVRPQRHPLCAVPLLRVTLFEAHASFLRRLCVRCRECYRDIGEMSS